MSAVSSDQIIGLGSASLSPVSSFMSSTGKLQEVAAASPGDQEICRSNLGLGSIAIKNSGDFLSSLGAFAEIASSGSGLQSSARANLGLGSSATQPSGAFIPSGSTIINVNLSRAAIQSSGSPYTLTSSSAAITFGGISPSITLPSSGAWALFANTQTTYSGASFLATQKVSYKLRCTNTSTDIPGSIQESNLGIVTTLSISGPSLAIGPILYTTTGISDSISLYGNISALPSLGSIICSQANITALRMSP